VQSLAGEATFSTVLAFAGKKKQKQAVNIAKFFANFTA